MSAKRVTASAIDWAAFSARVPLEQKAQYAAFKGKCDGYLRKVAALPESLPKIHWDQYSTRIAIPGMVEEFRKQYESLKIPYPQDKYSANISEAEKKAVTQIQEYIKQSNLKIAEHQQELVRWDAIPPFEEMTLEEFAEHFPDNSVNVYRNSLFPHTPEVQPGYVPEEGLEEKQE